MRSVILWCKSNSVFILHQGNAQLVNSSEFILSFYKPFINHLKVKHKDWESRFIDYLEGNIQQLISDSPSFSSIPQRQSKQVNKNNPFLKTLKEL